MLNIAYYKLALYNILYIFTPLNALDISKYITYLNSFICHEIYKFGAFIISILQMRKPRKVY